MFRRHIAAFSVMCKHCIISRSKESAGIRRSRPFLYYLNREDHRHLVAMRKLTIDGHVPTLNSVFAVARQDPRKRRLAQTILSK